ncbi:MAG: methyltransferase domain-containing protein [Leptolyngbyaceae cyanobacterium SL_5_9]|nr:methyltransferase domain-containing protein [Leptolyngbyaceae cyanobacterium SL_5_9]NJO75273.1 methyltransferase domain-containing protein [Leptolyngbyaceae cyanobacterium RM1_406_9]
MTTHPPWYYNDVQQVGTDFEDVTQVEAYDRNQPSSSAEKSQKLVTQLGILEGQSIIDFGCGTGTFAIQAAIAGAHVYAIDVSHSMLTFSQQKAQLANVSSRIELHHSGFLTYEHTAAPVDVIVTQAALHHLPDFWKMAAFLRIANMLKPDGIFYLWDTVFSFHPTEYQTRINEWIQRVAKPPCEGWTTDDFETHVREEYTTFGWILERMLTDAGFTIEMANYVTPEYAEYVCRK